MPADSPTKERSPRLGNSTKAVANLLLDWAEAEARQITPLKLQKLLYFCHADFLLRQGVPLVRDEFEAWSYGPVAPTIYHAFKRFGAGSIIGRCSEFDPITCGVSVPRARLNDRDLASLREIYAMYAVVPATTLSDLSHREGGPWDRALKAFSNNQNINRRIANEAILAHHEPAAM